MTANTPLRKLFGTDGIRGVANRPPMDSETLLALARTLAQNLLKKPSATVVIGKDTRASGYMLETALASGLISEGVNVIYTGPVPTPAVPFLVREYGADLGVMLTASHNPWQDNGVKLFNENGEKLSDADQESIERHFSTTLSNVSENLGQARRGVRALSRYKQHLFQALPTGFSLSSQKIVLDCANGAAYHIAPELFRELGAKDVIALNTSPNGRNINGNCGATQPQGLQKAVVEQGADIGLAFDGDADRLIAVDEKGRVLDGDQIMAAVMHHWVISEGYTGSLVCTVMSNKGMDRFLEGMGITVHRTDVGDRHVIACMQEINARFGGEQSGHMIFRDHGLIGDGILSSLKLLQILQNQDIVASRIGETFAALVQKKQNLPLPETPVNIPAISAEAQEIVGQTGQVLVRSSGTEPVLRLMVQAEDEALAERAMQSLISAVA